MRILSVAVLLITSFSTYAFEEIARCNIQFIRKFNDPHVQYKIINPDVTKVEVDYRSITDDNFLRNGISCDHLSGSLDSNMS